MANVSVPLFIITVINCFLSAYSEVTTSPNKIVKGYEHCPELNDKMLNVHIAAHTHDDVGWVKTIDDYFNGQVQYILDSVLEALEENPERKFVYVEMSFFSQWWNLRNESVHQRIIKLVNSGQLQFVGGGWCMADEATTSYSDIINQMTLGRRFINNTFGPVATPKTIWQIDPFGHSRETASLTAQMGFDGLFLGRLDQQDKNHRQETKTMEFLWNASNNLGFQSQLFTGVLYNMYYPPDGFCEDCSIPNQGYPTTTFQIDEFISYAQTQAQYYTTNNIILAMGNDFHYSNAQKTFKFLDELIKVVNEQNRVNVIYSTPSCYLYAVNQASKEYMIKTDDFMPYTADSTKYWTGYYTSRPTFKGLVKYTGNVLNIAKQLTTYANRAQDNLDLLSRYQSDSQHHDSITGTAQQAVSNDYTKRLALGLMSAITGVNEALKTLIPIKKDAVPLQQICYYLNISYCNATENVSKFIVTVYNPLGQAVVSHVRIPVAGSVYSVRGPDGTTIFNELVPVPNHVLNHPERKSSATYDLVFNNKLPPSGFNSYFIAKSDPVITNSYPKPPSIDYIENEVLLVTMDNTTGLLQSITNKEIRKTYNIKQNFYYYIGLIGSGAYSFLPEGDAQLISHTATITIISGKEVQEIHQTFSDYVSQIIRLYPGEKKVEFEWMVGPIPTEDSYGKEIITRYNSDLKNGGIFYTDSNGREMIERKLNYRPTWDVKLSQTISGNYYPISNSIYIRDAVDDVQMTVITDRAEGGSSLSEGAIELMVHRRLLYDDGFGVNEALNEKDVDGLGLRVRGKHWLCIGPIEESSTLHRTYALTASNPPLVLINSNSESFDNYTNLFKTTYTGLTAPLPDNVHLLTVEKLADGSVLLRFEHYFEMSDNSGELSKPVKINIKNLFTAFEIVSIRETILSADMWLSDVNKLEWNSPAQNNDLSENPKEDNDMVVILEPMQIRTFIVNVRYYY